MLECLDLYESVSLNELKLLDIKNRRDTRYVLTKEKALELLSEIDKRYKLLEVEGDRVIGYETSYYDTYDFALFNEHLKGRGKKYNIRLRSYSTSRDTYIDIKESSKGKYVSKTVMPYKSEADFKKVLQNVTPYNLFRLEEKISVHFNRFTFVDIDNSEKFTIDLDLGFTTSNSFESLTSMAIIEVKSSKRFYISKIKQLLKKHRINTGIISKYCLGISLMYPDKNYDHLFDGIDLTTGNNKKCLGFM